jgi:4-hydroxymandelate oxidase
VAAPKTPPSDGPVNLRDYEARANELLSPAAAAYFRCGADDERTLRENRAAFARYQILPRVLADVSRRTTATTVLGARVRSPILLAPTAMQRLAHPDGELATARAAAAAGTIMTLSTVATRSIEAVAEARRTVDPDAVAWFQLYPQVDRGLMRALVERSEAAGYGAIVVTVDTPVVGRREADVHVPLHLPPGVALENFAGLEGYDDIEHMSILKRFVTRHDASYTWDDVTRLCAQSRLPIVLKGVLRADDARRAAESGAGAIVVSNHGGRQLDGTVAGIDALAGVVEAVGDSIEVLVDGGVRRGVDVLVALALGAQAVMIGRPALWGLAVDGERGVLAVLDLLAAELDRAMALAGCATVDDVTPDLVAELPRLREHTGGRPRRSGPPSSADPEPSSRS